MLLKGILDDDIQGHSSHKGDNVQLSPKKLTKSVTVKTRITAVALKTKK